VRPSCSPASACARTPDTLIKHIGVGKQQLVEIAKALSKNVKLLILDEPTAALNESDSKHLLDLMLRPQGSKGMTSIMISHKLNEIAAIADSITVIRDGQHRRDLSTSEAGQVDEDRIIKGDGRPFHREPLPRPRAEDRRDLFEVKDWTVEHPHPDRWSPRSTFNVRAGRDRRLRRPDGRRTHRAGHAFVFGRSYGT
jgi:putative multiple sugar transport system ATP-binding protein